MGALTYLGGGAATGIDRQGGLDTDLVVFLIPPGSIDVGFIVGVSREGADFRQVACAGGLHIASGDIDTLLGSTDQRVVGQCHLDPLVAAGRHRRFDRQIFFQTIDGIVLLARQLLQGLEADLKIGFGRDALGTRVIE